MSALVRPGKEGDEGEGAVVVGRFTSGSEETRDKEATEFIYTFHVPHRCQ